MIKIFPTQGFSEGHNLLLCYMNIHENLFLYLSHETTFIVLIYATRIFKTCIFKTSYVVVNC